MPFAGERFSSTVTLSAASVAAFARAAGDSNPGRPASLIGTAMAGASRSARANRSAPEAFGSRRSRSPARRAHPHPARGRTRPRASPCVSWKRYVRRSLALDATARRAALDAARAGDTRFRAMADAAPVLVWLAAPDVERTWFNSQWLAFVGSRLDQEIGAGWLARGAHRPYRAALVT